jgi:hypothetical protein
MSWKLVGFLGAMTYEYRHLEQLLLPDKPLESPRLKFPVVFQDCITSRYFKNCTRTESQEHNFSQES